MGPDAAHAAEACRPPSETNHAATWLAAVDRGETDREGQDHPYHTVRLPPGSGNRAGGSPGQASTCRPILRIIEREELAGCGTVGHALGCVLVVAQQSAHGLIVRPGQLIRTVPEQPEHRGHGNRLFPHLYVGNGAPGWNPCKASGKQDSARRFAIRNFSGPQAGNAIHGDQNAQPGKLGSEGPVYWRNLFGARTICSTLKKRAGRKN